MAITRGPLRGPRPWVNEPPQRPKTKRASGVMSEALTETSGDDGNVTIAVPQHLIPQIERIIQMNANQNQNAEATVDTAENIETLAASVSETESKLNTLRERLTQRLSATKTAVTGSTAKRVAKAAGIVAGVAAIAGGGYYAYRRWFGQAA